MIKTVMDRKCTQILAEKDQTHSLCGHQVIDRRLNVSTFNLCIRLRRAKFREVGLYEKISGFLMKSFNILNPLALAGKLE